MKYYARIVIAALIMYALVCVVLLLVGGILMLSASRGEGLLFGLALMLPFALGGLWYWRYGQRHSASFVSVTTGLLVVILAGFGSYVAGFPLLCMAWRRRPMILLALPGRLSLLWRVPNYQSSVVSCHMYQL